MNQSKKRNLIMITIILVVIVGIICWISLGRKSKETLLDGNTSKVANLYAELKQAQAYSMTTTLNEQNNLYYAKKGNMAYVNICEQGKNSKYIIKNGNSYLLLEDQKTYYTYSNNETNLGKIEVPLETLKNSQYVEGKEKIEGKQYQYEEYEGITEFLIKDVTEQAEEAKTRLYFDGNKLEYIKTTVGAYQELLKVDISYKVDDKLFELPSDYKEA